MKNKIIILIVLICFGITASQAQKIGFLNTNDLLVLMPEVKSADSILVKYASEMQEIYYGYVLDYQKKLDDYNKNSATWSAVKKESAEKDLQIAQQRINDYEQESNDKLAEKKEELYGPILADVKAKIKLVGEENKLTAILDGSALLYFGADAVDILPMMKKKLGL
ncbi:MAG: OmpH family outer membrane protein [Chitinophagales bacterium]|jgi:outer membrane protein|nr:OmpH family outer membrane protein [Bacteroidota bacterium]MBP8915159.1 OmpH family outer membrane protein [Chitinophagales bacterium]MBP9219857.1 OmpH family outer membrane protein [Chitinophagales bacterium]MBP9794389.1 OmpH family outer membrane protein [Chitinophagales bacterium]